MELKLLCSRTILRNGSYKVILLSNGRHIPTFRYSVVVVLDESSCLYSYSVLNMGEQKQTRAWPTTDPTPAMPDSAPDKGSDREQENSNSSFFLALGFQDIEFCFYLKPIFSHTASPQFSQSLLILPSLNFSGTRTLQRPRIHPLARPIPLFGPLNLRFRERSCAATLPLEHCNLDKASLAPLCRAPTSQRPGITEHSFCAG